MPLGVSLDFGRYRRANTSGETERRHTLGLRIARFQESTCPVIYCAPGNVGAIFGPYSEMVGAVLEAGEKEGSWRKNKQPASCEI